MNIAKKWTFKKNYGFKVELKEGEEYEKLEAITYVIQDDLGAYGAIRHIQECYHHVMTGKKEKCGYYGNYSSTTITKDHVCIEFDMGAFPEEYPPPFYCKHEDFFDTLDFFFEFLKKYSGCQTVKNFNMNYIDKICFASNRRFWLESKAGYLVFDWLLVGICENKDLKDPIMTAYEKISNGKSESEEMNLYNNELNIKMNKNETQILFDYFDPDVISFDTEKMIEDIHTFMGIYKKYK